MNERGSEKEAGRMEFVIETVEMKVHCSAEKTMRRKDFSGREMFYCQRTE
jgi:hypothetical protein